MGDLLRSSCVVPLYLLSAYQQGMSDPEIALFYARVGRISLMARPIHWIFCMPLRPELGLLIPSISKIRDNSRNTTRVVNIK